MLTKPKIADRAIVARLASQYGLSDVQVEFLPLGADQHSAVYKVKVGEAKYFLKLRSGNFNPLSVQIAIFLKHSGIDTVLAALPTVDGRLSTRLEHFHLILYPFIEGQDGFQVALSKPQWMALGAAMRHYQRVELPADLQAALPVEAYSPRWRESVGAFLANEAKLIHDDPICAQLADFMLQRRPKIEHLVEQVELLAKRMINKAPEHVLCHTDIHGGNILVSPDGELHIIDWDAPLLAPKERDLMFIGGGIGGVWNKAAEVEAFYQGYYESPGNGTSLDYALNLGYAKDHGSYSNTIPRIGAGNEDNLEEVDPVGLAYYRCERIVEDLALFAEAIFARSDANSDEDRRLSLGYFRSNFEPGGVLEIADETYSRGIRG